MERENKGESGGTEIRIKRARRQEGRRPAHEKLPELLIPLQFLILTLLRVPTHSLLLIPSRKYLWILIPQSLIPAQPLFSFFKFTLLNLAVPGLTCSTQDFRCGVQILTWGTWDLVPCPGIKPGPPALGVQSLSYWTRREVPCLVFLSCSKWILFFSFSLLLITQTVW